MQSQFVMDERSAAIFHSIVYAMLVKGLLMESMTESHLLEGVRESNQKADNNVSAQEVRDVYEMMVSHDILQKGTGQGGMTFVRVTRNAIPILLMAISEGHIVGWSASKK